MTDDLATDLVHLDGTAVLRVRGVVDMATTRRLSSALEGSVSLGVPLVVDLGGVTFMDSSGLHALIDARMASEHAQPLSVQNPPAQIRRLLAMTGLDDMISVGGSDERSRR
jgi:anti-anti-sigma factor